MCLPALNPALVFPQLLTPFLPGTAEWSHDRAATPLDRKASVSAWGRCLQREGGTASGAMTASRPPAGRWGRWHRDTRRLRLLPERKARCLIPPHGPGTHQSEERVWVNLSAIGLGFDDTCFWTGRVRSGGGWFAGLRRGGRCPGVDGEQRGGLAFRGLQGPKGARHPFVPQRTRARGQPRRYLLPLSGPLEIPLIMNVSWRALEKGV